MVSNKDPILAFAPRCNQLQVVPLVAISYKPAGGLQMPQLLS